MARTLEISEEQRRLLARLTHDEWTRLDKIRMERSYFMSDDPILKDQQEVEELEGLLR